MARKAKAIDSSPEPAQEDSEDLALDHPPSEIDPYAVLSIEKAATADQIKSAYRKAALKYHPDKAAPADRDAANQKFQEIAVAYAILSDERRRKRYDATGNTAETLDDDDFDWHDFFKSQKEEFSVDQIEKIKEEYQGSEEEKADLLRSYQENEGDMDMIYEEVMCSNVLDDDGRFRKIIDDAIKLHEIEAFPSYTKETKTARKKRTQKARAEEAEALELAEELGVKGKLFGIKESNEKPAKKGKGTSEDALMALIQQRQKGRAENFLDNLEAKYGKAGKRRVEEPPEEMFRRNTKKSKSKAT